MRVSVLNLKLQPIAEPLIQAYLKRVIGGVPAIGTDQPCTPARTLHQVDLALLVREMREDVGLTQTELAKKVGTTQSVIARLEEAEYRGHSLTMLERIAAVCGIALKLHAEKKPNFDREVALV